jgi:hypothetical protein
LQAIGEHLRDVREEPKDAAKVAKRNIRQLAKYLGQVELQVVFARMTTLQLNKWNSQNRFDKQWLYNVLDRVKNPAQNPKTTPRTMDSCSRAIREPRTSGGLISAMYRGLNMLQLSVSVW